MDIVDSHVHLYSKEASSAPAEWAGSRGEPGWAALVAPPGRPTLQGWSDPDALIAHMDEAGVATSVLVGWYWQRQETCAEQNGWYREWVRRHPGRLVAFAAAQPASGARCLKELESSLDAGLCGVGELLPQAQGYECGDPALGAVLELAGRRGVPVLVHATDPQAGPRAGPPTPLGGLARLAAEHLGTTLILAHWGGGMAFRGLPDGKEPPPNLYFDTAASPLLYNAGVFAEAAARVGPACILFGSDYPLILYPKGPREPRMKPFVDEARASGLEATELSLVLGANMRRLLSRGLAPSAGRV